MFGLVDLLRVTGGIVPLLIPAVTLPYLAVPASLICEFLASLVVVPDKYDIKPGSIGSIHGDKKEPSPARAETNTVVSNTIAVINNLLQLTKAFIIILIIYQQTIQLLSLY